MTASPNPEVPTLEQQIALNVLTEMTAKYRQAEAYFDDVRAGLVEAARDAKAHGVRPIAIQRITGWSKTTVHANTQMPTPSDRPDPSVRAPEQAVRLAGPEVQPADSGVPAAEHAQT